MPLREDKIFSTNSDGTKNSKYCIYCYKQGGFIDGCVSLNEKIQYSIKRAIICGVAEKDAKDMAENILPNLERWKIKN